MYFLFIDLKFDSGYTSLYFAGGVDNEFRKNYFFTNHGLPAYVRVSSMRQPIQR
jgi:hypothetical protein